MVTNSSWPLKPSSCRRQEGSNHPLMKKRRRKGRLNLRNRSVNLKRSRRNSDSWRSRKSVCSSKRSNSREGWKKNSSGRRKRKRKLRTDFVSVWPSNNKRKRSSWTHPYPCLTPNRPPLLKNSTTMHRHTINRISCHRRP